MMMFSTKTVELYHGSNTGADNNVLYSFKTKGIMPIGNGHGQGSGFYVFSDRKTAEHHAKTLKDEENWQAGFTTYADNSGVPMIVTVESFLEPSKWDLDYELNSKKIIKWIYDNWDIVSKHMEDLFDMERTKRFHYPETPSVLGGVNPSRTGVQLYPKEVGPVKSITTTPTGVGGTGHGEILGKILTKLKQKDPQTVDKFEELFFANMKTGVAIKYVGTETLTPKRIEIFKDGQWVQA